jgi:hypothetical protein
MGTFQTAEMLPSRHNEVIDGQASRNPRAEEGEADQTRATHDRSEEREDK